MVFGWGRKQEEKPAGEIQQNKEVRLGEIRQILESLDQLRASRTIAEIRHLRDSTEPLIEDLIKIGNVLEKDDLKVDDIDKHLAIIVVRGKKQVIDVIQKGVVHLSKVSSINDAKKLDSSLNQILKKLGDVLGRQTRVIHIFAKKYANQLKNNLEVMNSNRSEIHKLLKNYDSEKMISDEILEGLGQITTLQKAHMEKSRRVVVLTGNKKSLDEKNSSIKNSIAEIKSSEDYKKYLELKDRLVEFDTQKSKIKNEIDMQFTKISRPLSRYEYGSSLDKEQKNLLSRLVKNPFNVIAPQHKDSIIIILENVRKGILSGSISVKDVDKSMSYLTETEETLDGFIKQISEYLERHEKMKDELSSLASGQLESLENELQKNILLWDDSELKSKTFQDEIDEIDLKIPQLVSEIEKKLRRFSNTRYSILMS